MEVAKQYDGSTAGSLKHIVFFMKIHRKSPQIAYYRDSKLVNDYIVAFSLRQGPLGFLGRGNSGFIQERSCRNSRKGGFPLREKGQFPLGTRGGGQHKR